MRVQERRGNINGLQKGPRPRKVLARTRDPSKALGSRLGSTVPLDWVILLSPGGQAHSNFTSRVYVPRRVLCNGLGTLSLHNPRCLLSRAPRHGRRGRRGDGRGPRLTRLLHRCCTKAPEKLQGLFINRMPLAAFYLQTKGRSGEGGIRTHETVQHRLRDFQSQSCSSDLFCCAGQSRVFMPSSTVGSCVRYKRRPIRGAATLSVTATCCDRPSARRSHSETLSEPSGRFYAESCIRTSENASSTHSGE